MLALLVAAVIAIPDSSCSYVAPSCEVTYSYEVWGRIATGPVDTLFFRVTDPENLCTFTLKAPVTSCLAVMTNMEDGTLIVEEDEGEQIICFRPPMHSAFITISSFPPFGNGRSFPLKKCLKRTI